MSKPKTADRLDKLELLLEKLVEGGSVKSSKGKAKQRPSTWEDEEEVLEYKSSIETKGKKGKFSSPLLALWTSDRFYDKVNYRMAKMILEGLDEFEKDLHRLIKLHDKDYS